MYSRCLTPSSCFVTVHPGQLQEANGEASRRQNGRESTRSTKPGSEKTRLVRSRPKNVRRRPKSPVRRLLPASRYRRESLRRRMAAARSPALRSRRHAQAAAPSLPPRPRRHAAARKPGFYEAVAIYERGVQALQRHDYAGAAGFFRTVLERYPEERELLERARLYLRVCERETARQPTGPKTPAERVYAATVAFNSGDHSGALDHLQRALGEDPESDHAHYIMAVALGMRDRADEARRASAAGNCPKSGQSRPGQAGSGPRHAPRITSDSGTRSIRRPPRTDAGRPAGTEFFAGRPP